MWIQICKASDDSVWELDVSKKYDILPSDADWHATIGGDIRRISIGRSILRTTPAISVSKEELDHLQKNIETYQFNKAFQEHLDEQ